MYVNLPAEHIISSATSMFVSVNPETTFVTITQIIITHTDVVVFSDFA